MKPLRLVVSAIWSTLSALARAMVRAGFLRPADLGVRVVSVGNIQAGGAGKTPLVAKIANEARERGLQVCILCRGYGGTWEGTGGIILPNDASILDPSVCGDEPALLHDLAPAAWIAVGADRVKQFAVARSRFKDRIDLVILDDGFQHWRIRKDVEIVALTSARRMETFFRDFPGAVSKADLVVWTKGDRAPDPRGRPLVKVGYRIPPTVTPGKFWLVTGVADNKTAEAMIRAAGYQVVRHVRFTDHARYSERAIVKVMSEAKAAGCSVMVTGKDWVKWRFFGLDRKLVTVVEPVLTVEEGGAVWSRALWGG